MKTISTMVFCACLAPGVAFAQQGGTQAPDRQQTQQEADRTTGGAQQMERRQSMTQTRMSGVDADTNGFLSATPGQGISVDSLVGSSVKSRADNEDIGNVEDILIDQDGKPMAVIVSVGGFLGVGSKDVAVSWDSVSISHKDGDRDLDTRRGASVTGTGAAGANQAATTGGARGATADGRQTTTAQAGAARSDVSPDDYVLMIDTDRDTLRDAPEFSRDW